MESVGMSRILLAAMSYWANESISRLRTFDASAMLAEEGGRLESLFTGLECKGQLHVYVLTVKLLRASEI